MSQAQHDVTAGLEQLRAYWEGRARSRLSDLEKLEWTHRRTQRMRFEAFLQDHDLAGRTVLDVGCGLGDFYAHLRQRGIDAHYTGYDISPAMVRQCRSRYGDTCFESGNFLDFAPDSRFDYTVAFGIHNIRVPDGRAILEQVTGHQFRLASIAAHVSLLSDRCTSFAPHIQAWPAGEVLELALGITPRVVLRHDYLDGDFSVTLYRAAGSTRRPEPILTYDYE
jgi:SAM-dependent methyltransferase